MKTPFFKRAAFALCGALLVITAISAFSRTAYAVLLPTVSSAVIQNSNSSTVDIVITGANFDRFFDSESTTADSTDLSHIRYNGTIPQTATMSGSVITATFPISVGSYKSGGAISIAASTLNNQALTHNTSTLSVANANITDDAKPIVVSSDIDGDALDAATTSPQPVEITFSEPVTIPTISISPDGGTQTVTDCGDANAATWCFDYAIPSANTTETIAVSGALDLSPAENAMDSDSNHQFTVSPYEDSLDIVGDMVNDGASQVEIIVPSTGPTLTSFWYSGTTTAGGTDLSHITYNGVNPNSASIDTEDNALDLFFNISLSDPQDGISPWDITTSPNGDLDIAQQTVVANGSIGNDEDYVPQDLITDDAAPVIVAGDAENSGGSSPTTSIRLSLSENVVDVDGGDQPHPNFAVYNATTGQPIAITGGDIAEGSSDNHVNVVLDTSDANDYDGPLTFSYDSSASGAQIYDGTNYMASVTDFPVTEANEDYGGGGGGGGGGPTQISSCSDLENLVNANLSGSYQLTQDLTCSGDGNAVRIATGESSFSGTFDGQGHTITVAIDVNGNFIGLFGSLDGATVTNLRIAGSVQGQGETAALAAIENNSTISYVENDASVSSSLNSDVGGLVADAVGGSISDSYNAGSVNGGSTNNVGGLVGSASNGLSIVRSYDSGSVSGGSNVGGLVGSSDGSGSITDSFSAGAISASSSDGALIGTASGMTLTNDYFDADGSTLGATCAADNAGACTPENEEGSSPSYFKSNSTHPPFDQWNFVGVWNATDGDYPSLQNDPSNSTPDQVTVLSANAVSSSEIDLSWTAPRDNGSPITGYRIAQRVGSGGFHIIVLNSGTTNTTYSDTGLSPNTDYTYQVFAINAVGTGLASSSANATTPTDGGGGGGGPVSISSCSDFENLINANLSGSYVLTQSIDCHLDGNAVMIGDDLDAFQGTFDGQGNTITVAIDDSSGDDQTLGLFRQVSGGATISNLTVAGTVEGQNDIGALAGDANGSSFTNDSSSATITVDSNDSEGPAVGGLVGALSESSILGSSVTGNIVANGPTTFLGGLVGVQDSAGIGFSYVTGNVTSYSSSLGCGVGGFVGCELGESELIQNYAGGAVSANYSVGGFAGGIDGALATDSYATGNVAGDSEIGGFAGWITDDSEVQQAYASGSVTGDNGSNGGGQEGGFAGEVGNSTIDNSFSTGFVSDVTGAYGGFIGNDNGNNTYSNDFYDQLASGQTGCTQNGDIAGQCTAVNTTGSPDASHFLDNSTNAPFTASGSPVWDFTTPIWDTVSGGLPILNAIPSIDQAPPSVFAGGDGSEHHPYVIRTCDQLQDVGSYLSSDFILDNDIDCKATDISNSSDPSYDAALYNGGAGFTRIGNDTSKFTGTFNGNNHVIENLFMNDEINDNNGFGLFGATDTHSVIEHVGLLYSNITGTSYVGSLVGDNNGTIRDSFVRGVLNANGNFSGLMVGTNYGPMSDDYASGSISGSSYTGGLAGFNGAAITDSYADVAVNGSSGTGGLVGRLFSSGTLTNVFATGSVTSSDNSSAGSIAGENDSATITNAFSSVALSGQPSCFPSGDNTGCTDARARNYFYNSDNEPMNSFTGFLAHWQNNTSALPTLAWEVPEIVSLSPADQATGIDEGTPLTITFDRAVTGVSGKHITIINTADDSIVVTLDAGDVSGNGTTTVSIPTEMALSDSKTYAVEIDPGAFVDTNSLANYGITALNVWTFTTSGGNGGGGGTVGDIKVTVTDVAGTPISGATVNVACPRWGPMAFVTLGTSDSNGIVEVNPTTVTDSCSDGNPVSLQATAGGYINSEEDSIGNYGAGVDPENEVDDSTANQYTIKMIPSFNGTGSGTSGDPYIISDCMQLEGIDSDLTADYKIVPSSGNAIDCSGIDFQPIGINTESGFTGTLDGNNSSITNLTINQSENTDDVGLFSEVTNATIENLTLASGSVTGGYEVGSLVGDLEDGATLTNISSALNVEGLDDWEEGGLVGDAYINNGAASTFSNLTYTGTIDNPEGYIGGIFGELEVYNTDTTVVVDHATVSGGTIGSSDGEADEVGGLIGDLNIDTGSDGDPAGLTISNSTVSSTVSATQGNSIGGLIGDMQADGEEGTSAVSITDDSVTGAVSGNYSVGGLIGSFETYDDGGSITTDIDGSSMTNTVTGTGSEIGGLLGHVFVFGNDSITSQLTLQNSFMSGNVIGDGDVGGLIGGTDGEGPGIDLGGTSTGGLVINHDYASGNVTGNVNDDGAYNAGGLVGFLACYSNSSNQPYACSVSSSYASGDVSGYENVGGFIGDADGDSSIADAYADGNISGNQEVGGFIGYANQDGTNLSISNTYAGGSVAVTGSSPQNFGGLIGQFDTNAGAVTLTHSFSAADLSKVTGATNSGWLVGQLGQGITPTDLWYATLSDSDDLACVGNVAESPFCTSEALGSFFQNSTTDGPLTNWNFTNTWISNSNEYPTLVNPTQDFSGAPVLATVTPISSQTTAANAIYTFSNTGSHGGYEFAEITQSVGGTVTTHLDPVTHQVTFTGLQVGGTYSTSFNYVVGNEISNTLDIGPFTVIASAAPAPVVQVQGINSAGGYLPGYSTSGKTPASSTEVASAAPSQPASSSGGSYHFPRSLKQNIKQGGDIAILQKFLNGNGFPVAKSGPGSAGHETNKFGPATKAALIKFQKANRLSADGILGPKTRAAIESIMNK